MIGSNTFINRTVRGQLIVWHRKLARTTVEWAYVRYGRVSNAPGYPGFALLSGHEHAWRKRALAPLIGKSPATVGARFQSAQNYAGLFRSFIALRLLIRLPEVPLPPRRTKQPGALETRPYRSYAFGVPQVLATAPWPRLVGRVGHAPRTRIFRRVNALGTCGA